MPMKILSTEEKVYGLSLIWKEAEYNYAFWDKKAMPDWDEAYRLSLPKVLEAQNLYDYYLELKRFINLLRDGHTDVWFPRELYSHMGYLPLLMAFIEGKHVIINYKECMEKEIEPYSEVLKINDIAVDKYLEENIYPYCWREKYDSAYSNIFNTLSMGAVGSTLDFEILSPQGDIKRISIKRIIQEEHNKQKWCVKRDFTSNTKTEELYRSDSHYILKTSDNIVILGIPTFMKDSLREEYYKNLHLLKEAKGILIDIRNNGGGNSGNGDAVAQSFIEGSFTTSSDKRMVHIGTYKAWGKGQNFKDKTYEEVIAERGYSSTWLEKTYKISRRVLFETNTTTYHDPNCPSLLTQPVVILANHNTGSAAEDFLIELDHAKRVTIVGTASYGSTGQPLTLELPGGGVARICTRQCTYPDGREFINLGVQPHHIADLTISDFRNGYDSVLDKGIRVLKSMIE